MSYLFQIKGSKVYPNTETLLIEPFKSIWERDTSEHKVVAIKEFSYIEFMASVKISNPYRGYPTESRDELLRKEYFHKDWEPDDLIISGIQKIDQFQTEGSETYTYWQSATKAAEKLEDFFNNVDLDERNKAGTPIYKPSDITRALNDTEKVMQNLSALKKKVDEELFESTRTKGDKPISPFANPSSMK